MTDQESTELSLAICQYKLRWTQQALLDTARDLARAGMSNYAPTNKELLKVAGWCFGLEQSLEKEIEQILKGEDNDH